MRLLTICVSLSVWLRNEPVLSAEEKLGVTFPGSAVDAGAWIGSTHIIPLATELKGVRPLWTRQHTELHIEDILADSVHYSQLSAADDGKYWVVRNFRTAEVRDRQSTLIGRYDPPPGRNIGSLAISRDGLRLAMVHDVVGKEHDELVLYDIPKPNKRTFQLAEGPVGAIAFSSDGDYCIVGHHRGVIEIINVAILKRTHKFASNLFLLREVRLSSDGELVGFLDFSQLVIFRTSDWTEVSRLTVAASEPDNRWHLQSFEFARDSTAVYLGGVYEENAAVSRIDVTQLEGVSDPLQLKRIEYPRGSDIKSIRSSAEAGCYAVVIVGDRKSHLSFFTEESFLEN